MSLVRDDRFDQTLIVVRQAGVDIPWNGNIRNLIWNVLSMEWEAQTSAASGGGSSAGLTDAQLRAVAVPVSGSVSSAVTYASFQAYHQTLAASTDTTITFSQTVKFVRVTNWDITNPILVKNGAIAADTDSASSRVGIAPAINLSNSESFPITTTSIHIRSAGTSTVTVEGFV